MRAPYVTKIAILSNNSPKNTRDTRFVRPNWKSIYLSFYAHIFTYIDCTLCTHRYQHRIREIMNYMLKHTHTHTHFIVSICVAHRTICANTNETKPKKNIENSKIRKTCHQHTSKTLSIPCTVRGVRDSCECADAFRSRVYLWLSIFFVREFRGMPNADRLSVCEKDDE